MTQEVATTAQPSAHAGAGTPVLDTPALANQLANMPNALLANQALAERAVLTVEKAIAPLLSIDLKTVDAQVMEQNDKALADFQSKLKETYTLMTDRRKPFTQRMDEIKSHFTACEAKVKTVGEKVKTLRDSWQGEKAKRQAAALAEQQKELEKKQALIDVRTYIAQRICDQFATLAVQTIKRMHETFYAKTITELDSYGVTLGKWTPGLSDDTWAQCTAGIGNPKPQFVTPEQMAAIQKEVEAEQRQRLSKEWVERMTQERNGLVELVPSRKMELERIAKEGEAAAKEAQERIAREAEEREAAALKEAADKAQALAAAAEVDKMNSSFDVASQAVPVVGISKGTVVKKKYVPKSHKAHVAIVQWWVSNCMALMTLEELQTKLSFMRTAADKALNEGVTIEADGLEVIEDYSTRAGSRKKEVA